MVQLKESWTATSPWQTAGQTPGPHGQSIPHTVDAHTIVRLKYGKRVSDCARESHVRQISSSAAGHLQGVYKRVLQFLKGGDPSIASPRPVLCLPSVLALLSQCLLFEMVNALRRSGSSLALGQFWNISDMSTRLHFSTTETRHLDRLGQLSDMTSTDMLPTTSRDVLPLPLQARLSLPLQATLPLRRGALPWPLASAVHGHLVPQPHKPANEERPPAGLPQARLFPRHARHDAPPLLRLPC